MALAHAVMSLLAKKACSGYEIAKEFEDSVGYFWQATHQQIYRELKKLEEQGWVGVEVIAQGKPLDKKIYHLTELGQQKLTEWIGEDCGLGPIREDILVKVFAGGLVSPQVLLQQLEQNRRLHLKRLEAYEDIEKRFFAHSEELSYGERCQYSVLKMGIGYEKAWNSWCEESIEMLQNVKE
ncbi:MULTISPECIES: PadR family transcriptional regulator [Nostocales]|uniref:PadR family transcriptional regulator n=3 Tax=Nostocales TaxID=1161 RepID=A0A0C1RM79_9CYAN|nr:PadR family transcriptional regulator [Tolypothrix bouteillei]KAF3887982.1 PadR family transcriptional regulator [Tolypothrix bouteillei VB521301]